MKSIFICSVLWCILLAPSLYAEDSSVEREVSALKEAVEELRNTVEAQSKTIHEQGKRIEELERSNAQLQKAPAPGPVASAPSAMPQTAGLSAFNPEIGVVADITGQLSESSLDTEGNDRLSARELELVFGHPIDPYSRMDATISFSDFETPSLEEAYITHWGLPGVRAKLGRLRPKVGKASPLHRDSLDTVDEPLVVSKYFGPEGLSRTGVELTGFLPVPWAAVTHELTAGVLEGGVGEGGTLFGETRRRPTFYTHLKNFWDISDETNFETGATYVIGSKDTDAALEVNVLGLDATLVHYVTPTNKLKIQGEAYLQDRKESDFNKTPWGAYSLVDYRLSPRFGVGSRFDYVEPVDLNPAVAVQDGDVSVSGYLTFYQSEFARWRLQYKYTDFAQGGDDNTVFLQGTMAIGVHKHQLQ